jgi:hypothetical protein
MRWLAVVLATIAALATGAAAAADLRVVTPAPTLTLLHPFPTCDQAAVLGKIARKFADQDAVLIHSGLGIVTIDKVVQTRFKDGPSLTYVRFCTGRALLTNGRTSEVVFIVERPMKGKYSLGWAVESCLPGFDPFRVYDGNCRSIRS